MKGSKARHAQQRAESFWSFLSHQDSKQWQDRAEKQCNQGLQRVLLKGKNADPGLGVQGSWRQHSLPRPPCSSLPLLDLFPLWPWEGWHCVEETAGPSQFWLSHLLDAWIYRVPSLQWPEGISSWRGSAQHNLQPDSLTGRSRAALPKASSFFQKAVWARGQGQRNLGQWGHWSLGGRCHLVYSVTVLLNPFYNPYCTLLYPLLPVSSCLSPNQWCVGKCLTKALLKKRHIHIYLTYAYKITFFCYKEWVASFTNNAQYSLL